MNLPRPEFYTVDGLAECWGVKSSLVEGYIASGQLLRTGRYEHVGGCYMLEGDYHPDSRSEEQLRHDGYSLKCWLIKLEEVERFEQEHGFLGCVSREDDKTSFAPLFDASRKEYPKKLAVAIEAWGAVTSDPQLLKKHKSPKAALAAWLKGNKARYPWLNKQTIEDIAKVANWKSGGPKETP